MNRGQFSASRPARPAAIRSGLAFEMRKCRRLADEFAGKPEEQVLQNLVREYGKLVRNMNAAKRR